MRVSLHIRVLQTLQQMASSGNSSVIFMPTGAEEISRAFGGKVFPAPRPLPRALSRSFPESVPASPGRDAFPPPGRLSVRLIPCPRPALRSPSQCTVGHGRATFACGRIRFSGAAMLSSAARLRVPEAWGS